MGFCLFVPRGSQQENAAAGRVGEGNVNRFPI